jgi:hypothetical protein
MIRTCPETSAAGNWRLPALIGLLLITSPHIAAQQPASAGGTAGAYSMVPSGARFLVRLENSLSTKKHKAGKRFKAKTLEPLETTDGRVIPPGAEIRGHVSRVEPAALTGRARLWLSFDELKVPGEKLPLVANVTSVPGEHSVRPGPSREGEIEARTSRGRNEAQAAAVGAGIGAVVGATAKGGKGAVVGAAIGGLSGFLIASGMGHELELQKNTKLELELERPLYVSKR